MAGIFETSRTKRSPSNYRYVPINVTADLETSSKFGSSEALLSSATHHHGGLPDLSLEDDCLPPSANGYGAINRRVSRTVLSRLPSGNVPPYRAVFLVTNAALGAGILNFPQAYMNAGGVQTAIIVQSVSCSICFIGLFRNFNHKVSDCKVPFIFCPFSLSSCLLVFSNGQQDPE